MGTGKRTGLDGSKIVHDFKLNEDMNRRFSEEADLFAASCSTAPVQIKVSPQYRREKNESWSSHMFDQFETSVFCPSLWPGVLFRVNESRWSQRWGYEDIITTVKPCSLLFLDTVHAPHIALINVDSLHAQDH